MNRVSAGRRQLWVIPVRVWLLGVISLGWVRAPPALELGMRKRAEKRREAQEILANAHSDFFKVDEWGTRGCQVIECLSHWGLTGCSEVNSLFLGPCENMISGILWVHSASRDQTKEKHSYHTFITTLLPCKKWKCELLGSLCCRCMRDNIRQYTAGKLNDSLRKLLWIKRNCNGKLA